MADIKIILKITLHFTTSYYVTSISKQILSVMTKWIKHNAGKKLQKKNDLIPHNYIYRFVMNEWDHFRM